jgi:hypothetical protein
LLAANACAAASASARHAKVFTVGKLAVRGEHRERRSKLEEMANEVLMRQAKARADRESIEEALEAILSTEAGTQLKELRGAPHDEESVEEWQVGMARERAQDLGDHLDEPP